MTLKTPLPETTSPGRLIARSLMLTLAFLLMRLPLLARSTLSGDEGVFGLMSLAIARGEEYPLYCWGAHYASALISYLAVPVMAALGVTAFAFKATTLPYGIVTMLLIYFALRRSFGELNAWLTALVFAIPAPTLLVFSIMAHGGYPEIYFLGVATWIGALGAIERPSPRRLFLLGFLVGAIISIYWLGIPFLVSAVVVLMTRRVPRGRTAAAGVAGFLVGAASFLYYNLWIAPGSTILRLAGRSLKTTDPGNSVNALIDRFLETPAWIAEASGGLGLLLSAYGGTAGGIMLLAAALWGAVRLARAGRDWGRLVLWFLAVLPLFLWAGGLGRERHWTIIFLAILVGLNGLPKAMARGLLVLLLLTGFYASWMEVRRARPDATVVTASAILAREKPDALVADYDLGYPIAFRSGGRFLLSTAAPPNPMDRRPDWTAMIRAARRVAVLLPPDTTSRLFEDRLIAHQVAYRCYELESRRLFIPDVAGDRLVEWLPAPGPPVTPG